jgi:hypothetical protein
MFGSQTPQQKASAEAQQQAGYGTILGGFFSPATGSVLGGAVPTPAAGKRLLGQ